MKDHFLIRTNYFSRKAIWIGRIFIISIFVTQLFIWEFESGFEYLRYALTLAVIVSILLSREEDIAVDETNFYYLKTSILPIFSKIKKFRIDELKSIRGKGYESWFWWIYGRGSMQGLDYGIEMSFKDNSSESLDVNIYKIDLEKVLNIVKERMSKSSV